MPSGKNVGPYTPRIRARTQDIGWQSQGACFRNGPEAFFPNTSDPKDEAAAKALCATCEVRWECLEFALETKDKFGIWGGRNPTERERIRRERAERRRRGAA